MLVAAAPISKLRRGARRLGELLIERNLLSPSELEAAIVEQRTGPGRLGELLLARGAIPRETLASALEEVTRIQYVNCSRCPIEPEAIAALPRELALRHCVMPLARDGPRLVVAMAEP